MKGDDLFLRCLDPQSVASQVESGLA